jgi:pimeloyl-ACP methyl ester carboxylesterase
MQERFIKNGDLDICCWDTGEPGWTVLLVHGNSAAKNSFENQFHSSSLDQHRLVALDLPGHGQSSWAEDYDVATYVNAIQRVIEELRLTDIVLVGHSLGGNIVIEAVDDIPQARGVAAFGAAPLAKPPEIAHAFLPHPSSIAFFTDDLSGANLF